MLPQGTAGAEPILLQRDTDDALGFTNRVLGFNDPVRLERAN